MNWLATAQAADRLTGPCQSCRWQPPRTSHLLGNIVVQFVCNDLGPHSFVLTTNSATTILLAVLPEVTLTFRWNITGFPARSHCNAPLTLRIRIHRCKLHGFVRLTIYHHRLANSVGHEIYGLITLAYLALPICVSKALRPCSSLVFMHMSRRHRLWNRMSASTGHNLNSHPAKLTCLTSWGDG